MKIKAAGGIRNEKDAREYVRLGCSRLGMSAGVAVMLECGADPLPELVEKVSESVPKKPRRRSSRIQKQDSTEKKGKKSENPPEERTQPSARKWTANTDSHPGKGVVNSH